MNTQTLLFDAAQRTGCVFSSGWRPGSGGTVNVRAALLMQVVAGRPATRAAPAI